MSHQNTESPAGEKGLQDLLLATAYQSEISRRGMFKLALSTLTAAALVANPLAAHAADATEETKAALASAQAEYDKVQAQLDELTAEYEALTKEQAKTLDKIEAVQLKIDDVQAQIDVKQAELEQKRELLGDRVARSYKAGDQGALALLLSSTSFEELISNTYYIAKINASDREAIKAVNEVQTELKESKADLDGQKADLESLRESQAKQIEAMQSKQAEVSELLSGLSDDVKELMAQRDAEIVAAAQAEAEEAARRKKAQEEAAKKQSVNNNPGYVAPGDGQQSGGNRQQAVVNACYSVPSPGANYCAMWVSQVFQRAGLGYPGGNANDMYANYCTYSDKANLKVGMIVAVSTYSKNYAGRIWGHVGIYIGNNQVMENIGYINTQSINSWCSYYGDTVTPRWGWALGINLEG